MPHTTADQAHRLLDLHTRPDILILPNVWDVVSARVVAATPGVQALATASHSIAATFGYPDGERIPLELHLDMVRRIVQAVSIPVSMDLEAGYGNPGDTARRAIEIGVAGGNLEDGMRPLGEAVAAVQAVMEAGRAAGVNFVLNARTDAVVRATPEQSRSQVIREVIARGLAFLEAGAPVVFVPGLVDRTEIQEVSSALGERKLTLISVPGASLAAREMQALGVARVSSGPFTQRVALTALQDAATELVAGGTLPAGTRPLN